ncbi:MAG: hypothetical protein ABJF23_23940 [Bryobacteraceae bacterium]
MTMKIVFMLALGVQYVTAMGTTKENIIPSCFPCDATAATVNIIPSCFPCDASAAEVKIIPSCFPCDASI